MADIERLERRLPVKTRRVAEGGGAVAGAEVQQPLIGFLYTIWQRRYFVLGCLAVSMIVAVAYLLNATKLYQGISTVYVQRSIPKIVEDQFSSSGQSTGYLFTQCQVIESTAILSSALQSPDVAQASCLQGVSNPVGFLKSIISAIPDKQGDLITVSAVTVSAGDSAIIANAVVQAYIDYLGSQHKSTSVEVLRILQKEMDRREKDLQTSREAMLAMRQENPTLAFDGEKDSIASSQLQEKIAGYSSAQTRVMDLETAAIEAKEAKDPESVRLLLQQYQIPFDVTTEANAQIAAQYAQAQRDVRNLLERLGPDHRLVQAEQNDLNDLQAALAASQAQTIKAYQTAIDTALTVARAKVKQYESLVVDTQKTAVTSNVKQAQYNQLAQESERAERSLDLLDSRMKEVGIGEDAGSLSVSVLETAKPNFMPFSPRQSKVLGLALIAGLMAGLGGAMLLDALDQKLYSGDEISAAMDIPVLGMIPRIVGRQTPIERAQEVHLRPRSNIAEAYRALRTAIVFSDTELGGARTILLTSAAMNEGKSTTVSNLAIAFANANRRVLLIDADCRRPVQAKMFKLKDGPGLSNVLSGQNKLADVIQKTSVDNLEILPSGPLPANPAELLDSAAFIELLNTLSANYDHILIDSPPVMPVTDARVLSAACDATILIIRSGRSTRRLAIQSRDVLISVGANLIGVIANDLSRGLHAYQYTGYRMKEPRNGRANRVRESKSSASPIVARSLPAHVGNDESDH